MNLVIANIPGWVVTVITQAVLLFGCCNLHFLRRLSSAGPQWGSAHSLIFGSGGKMRLRVNPPFSLTSSCTSLGCKILSRGLSRDRSVCLHHSPPPKGRKSPWLLPPVSRWSQRCFVPQKASPAANTAPCLYRTYLSPFTKDSRWLRSMMCIHQFLELYSFSWSSTIVHCIHRGTLDFPFFL